MSRPCRSVPCAGWFGFGRQDGRAEADVGALRAENQSLRDDNERLKLENDSLRLDNQLLRDEIARLKNLPPRPPFRPSGMENASKPAAGKNSSKGGRGVKRDRVTREVIVKADAPEGSRFKGYETILVRELVLRTESCVTGASAGSRPRARPSLRPAGGDCRRLSARLRRFCLTLHAQGQVTTERLTRLLNGIGCRNLEARGRAPANHGSGGFARRPRGPAGRA